MITASVISPWIVAAAFGAWIGAWALVELRVGGRYRWGRHAAIAAFAAAGCAATWAVLAYAAFAFDVPSLPVQIRSAEVAWLALAVFLHGRTVAPRREASSQWVTVATGGVLVCGIALGLWSHRLDVDRPDGPPDVRVLLPQPLRVTAPVSVETFIAATELLRQEIAP